MDDSAWERMQARERLRKVYQTLREEEAREIRRSLILGAVLVVLCMAAMALALAAGS